MKSVWLRLQCLNPLCERFVVLILSWSLGKLDFVVDVGEWEVLILFSQEHDLCTRIVHRLQLTCSGLADDIPTKNDIFNGLYKFKIVSLLTFPFLIDSPQLIDSWQTFHLAYCIKSKLIVLRMLYRPKLCRGNWNKILLLRSKTH